MTDSTLTPLPGGTRCEIIIPPFDVEDDPNLASIIPAQSLVVWSEQPSGPQRVLTHPTLPGPLTIDPRAPLALSASGVAALGAGFDRYPPLNYALADLGLPIGEAERITGDWLALTEEAQP